MDCVVVVLSLHSSVAFPMRITLLRLKPKSRFAQHHCGSIIYVNKGRADEWSVYLGFSLMGNSKLKYRQFEKAFCIQTISCHDYLVFVFVLIVFDGLVRDEMCLPRKSLDTVMHTGGDYGPYLRDGLRETRLYFFYEAFAVWDVASVRVTLTKSGLEKDGRQMVIENWCLSSRAAALKKLTQHQLLKNKQLTVISNKLR